MNIAHRYTGDLHREASVLNQKVKLLKEFSRLSGPEASYRQDHGAADRREAQPARSAWAPKRWE
jgi:hypothetical protein